jgi:RNA-directed DNA polymerase
MNDGKYTIITIPKKNGDRRVIYIPSEALKREQKALVNFFLKHFKVSPVCYSYRKGIGIKEMAYRHIGSKTVICIDIKDFFHSITDEHIRDILDKRFDEKLNKHFITYIVSVVCHPKYIYEDGKLREISKNTSPLLITPQGAVTSPVISNIVFYHIDNKLKEFAKHNSLTYTRYADDIIISAKERLAETRITKILQYVQNMIEYKRKASYTQTGFKVNEAKTKIYHHGQRMLVCGVVVNDKTVSVPKKYRRQVRAEIHTVLEALKHGKHIDSEVIEKLRGKVNWINHINSMQGKWFIQKMNEIEKLLF